MLSGPVAFTGAAVGIDQAGALTCDRPNVTCSGPTKSAKYTVTGTNNQVVTVNASDVTLTNAAAEHAALTV